MELLKISDKGIEKITLEDNLEEYQQAVGGYIEIDERTIGGEKACFISDEDGKLKNLEVRAVSSSTCEFFVGTLLVCGPIKHRRITSVTKAIEDAVKEAFDTKNKILKY